MMSGSAARVCERSPPPSCNSTIAPGRALSMTLDSISPTPRPRPRPVPGIDVPLDGGEPQLARLGEEGRAQRAVRRPEQARFKPARRLANGRCRVLDLAPRERARAGD